MAKKKQPGHVDAADFERHLLKAMREAGVDPAVIYAYQKTERIVSRENWKFLSPSERKEWNDAIREWCEAQGVGCDEIEFLEETSP